MSHSWLRKSVAYYFGTYRLVSFWLFTLPVRRGRLGFGFFVDPIPSEIFTDLRLSVLSVKSAQIGGENGTCQSVFKGFDTQSQRCKYCKKNCLRKGVLPYTVFVGMQSPHMNKR